MDYEINNVQLKADANKIDNALICGESHVREIFAYTLLYIHYKQTTYHES